MIGFSVINSKGGVGKTTVSVNLSHGLALRGHRVLLIDTDPQDNCRIWLDVPKTKLTLYNVLTDDVPLSKAISPARDNLWLCQSGGDALSAVPTQLDGKTHAASRLRTAIERFQDHFDFCFIDCSPSRTLLHTIAVVASDYILIPVNMEWLSAVGSIQVNQAIAEVTEKYQLSTQIGLVIPTFVDRRRNRVTDDVLDSLKTQYGEKLSTPIRVNSRISESPGYSQTIFDMKEPKAMEDFNDLIEEVLKLGH